MINSTEIREQCAGQLLAKADQVNKLTAFVGLDGFVDEIIHVVDTRKSAESFVRLSTIAKLAERIAAAAGKSSNIEMVRQLTKLGGNGPIMANALCSFGIKVTYVGALGHPALHPVFEDFAKRAEVHTIGEPGYTDALEFEDGKIMLGKMVQLREITWANIQQRFGADKLFDKLNGSNLVGFVNWTMIPYMSDVWESLLTELCPKLTGQRRKMFIDLADPEKRSASDINRALELITRFEKYFEVTLGLNEKEAFEINKVLGFGLSDHSPDGLATLAGKIHRSVPVSTVVVHPVAYALAASNGNVRTVQGPYCTNPLISTGAGDHFNSGFCLGKLLGMDDAMSLLVGVTTSGYYVRTAKSPGVAELAKTLQAWPSS